MSELANMSFSQMESYVKSTFRAEEILRIHSNVYDNNSFVRGGNRSRLMGPTNPTLLGEFPQYSRTRAEQEQIGTYEELRALDDSIQKRGISLKTKNSMMSRHPKVTEIDDNSQEKVRLFLHRCPYPSGLSEFSCDSFTILYLIFVPIWQPCPLV
eukprot:gene4533-8998_t